MGNVFFSIGLSLDGFIAGLNASPSNPLGDGGLNIHRLAADLDPLEDFGIITNP
jgi:hypothetical protein